MTSPQMPSPSIPEFIHALLKESPNPEPNVVVLVLDEKRERLLDIRCEPIADIAVLLSLYGVKPESIRSHSMEQNQ